MLTVVWGIAGAAVVVAYAALLVRLDRAQRRSRAREDAAHDGILASMDTAIAAVDAALAAAPRCGRRCGSRVPYDLESPCWNMCQHFADCEWALVYPVAANNWLGIVTCDIQWHEGEHERFATAWRSIAFACGCAGIWCGSYTEYAPRGIWNGPVRYVPPTGVFEWHDACAAHGPLTYSIRMYGRLAAWPTMRVAMLVAINRTEAAARARQQLVADGEDAEGWLIVVMGGWPECPEQPSEDLTERMTAAVERAVTARRLSASGIVGDN